MIIPVVSKLTFVLRASSLPAVLGVVLLAPISASGQISFKDAVALAVKNSPRVKMAQDDCQRASAALAATRDLYVPSIVAAGGLGASTGITLTVPTIFTLSAQSLIFSYSQRDYIRSARLALESSRLALMDVRERVEEDAAITYVALDEADDKERVLADELRIATRLAEIVQQRFDAGLETQQELRQARRTMIQVKLQQLETQDQSAFFVEHLKQLTGLPVDKLSTINGSVPPDQTFASIEDSAASAVAEAPAVLSAEVSARAKLERAFGDSRYRWRPQVGFAAQYGRVSPINGVTDYYNLHGDYNTASIGLQIQLPLLDATRRAQARVSLADASHALHEADVSRAEQSEDRLRMQHSMAELGARTELAEVDLEIARDQLRSIAVQTASGGFSGVVMTPRDKQNACLQERQRYLELLGAALDLRKSQLSFMRQAGRLEDWLSSLPDSLQRAHKEAQGEVPAC